MLLLLYCLLWMITCSCAVWWKYREVKEDGTLGPEEQGYGW